MLACKSFRDCTQRVDGLDSTFHCDDGVSSPYQLFFQRAFMSFIFKHQWAIATLGLLCRVFPTLTNWQKLERGMWQSKFETIALKIVICMRSLIFPWLVSVPMKWNLNCRKCDSCSPLPAIEFPLPVMRFLIRKSLRAGSVGTQLTSYLFRTVKRYCSFGHLFTFLEQRKQKGSLLKFKSGTFGDLRSLGSRKSFNQEGAFFKRLVKIC